MRVLCLKALFFFFLGSQASDLRIAHGSSLTCSQMQLPCKVSINNCFYEGWLKPWNYVPSGPEGLKVSVKVIKDENGETVPVIEAHWKAKDDGSIAFLNGTEIQVLKASGGLLCIHYVYFKQLPMKNPYGQLWSFSVDKIVVSPGEEYVVSVANLPKPNVDQDGYNRTTIVRVPGCEDPAMRQIQTCIKRGEFWQPNITTAKSGQHGREIAVSFETGENSETYHVIMKCDGTRQVKSLRKENSASLNVTFNLEEWPHTCCDFTVEIQPFFDICNNDCTRRRRAFSICSVPPPPKSSKAPSVVILLVGLFILLCGVCVICFIFCRKKLPKYSLQPPEEPSPGAPLSTERSVLIIYSRDHPKYTDVVLKLCAFLRAKCGTDVYLDLLDMACIGTMGRLPWTECQKRRIETSSDKVLVLCSRGVQAKWRAMCGGPPVHLREDVCSPVGDMLTLALQLITPDMQRPANFGKYLVAYFEDVSSEHDVPSIFDVAVKYQLMKDFEELFFRVLDLEKYQRGKVHTIEGIGFNEYFNCPSGKALRDAIEAFQAYQVQYPDWFEKECLDSEDEVLTAEINPFLDESTKILKCEPLINKGIPVHKCEVEVHNIDEAIGVQTVEISNLDLDYEEPSVQVIHPAPNQVYSLCPVLELPPCVNSAVECHPLTDSLSCLLTEPSLQASSPPCQSDSFANKRLPADGCSIDDLENLRKLQASLVSFQMFAPPPSLDDHNQVPWDIYPSHPIELDENEVADASGTKQSRWSDQGYSSRDSVAKEDPPQSHLDALAKLQETLYLTNPFSSGFLTQTTES